MIEESCSLARDASGERLTPPPADSGVRPALTCSRQQAQLWVQQGRITYLGWWTPGASRLTQAVTTAVLDSRGLHAEMSARRTLFGHVRSVLLRTGPTRVDFCFCVSNLSQCVSVSFSRQLDTVLERY